MFCIGDVVINNKKMNEALLPVRLETGGGDGAPGGSCCR